VLGTALPRGGVDGRIADQGHGYGAPR